VYDGALTLCSGGASAPRTVDFFLAFEIAYDVTFGWPAAWGSPGALREDLDFEMEVVPLLFAQLMNPVNFPKFEFIRRVMGLPPQDFVPNGGIFATMFFATEAGAELQCRANGGVAQNLDHVYTLSAADKAFLLSFGLNADPLLAAMNARRIPVDPNARNYVEHYADFRGDLTRLVFQMHTAQDSILPVGHMTVYRNTVQQAGRLHLLAQAVTNGIGHCNFTPLQLLFAIQAVDAWLRTGIRPDPATFPTGLGFLPNFQPPPWPNVP